MRLKTICLLLALIAGLTACSKRAKQAVGGNTVYWTCGMHPSIRLMTSGKCPICGMDLLPATPLGGEAHESSNPARGQGDRHLTATRNADYPELAEQSRSSEFTIPLYRQQQIGVTYANVRPRAMQREIHAVGTFEVDRTLSFDCVSRVDGYIEKLHVTSPGERVDAGQPLVSIYSPDLRAPEQEFVNLLRVRDSGVGPAESMEQLIESARRRLSFLNVSPKEIEELEHTHQPTDQLLFRSPIRGVIDQALVKLGMSVKQGDTLMTVIDLSNLYLWAEIYEDEIGLIQEGQTASVTVPALLNRTFEGKISLISPTIGPSKRTTRVRIDIPNPEGQLRPGMYANVFVRIDAGERLAVPFDAVLPTGSRMLVFVDKGFGKLEPRFIQVGGLFLDAADNRQERYYEVTNGLHEGDRIVSSANFLIDAEAQIQGAISDWYEPAESTADALRERGAGPATTEGRQSLPPSR